MTGLQFNNLTDIQVDYQSLMGHANQMIQALMALQNFTGPILPELASAINMTANNFKYKAAFDRFIEQDITQ